ncbi:MAG: type VII toxin-antitoxin system HepT family RNase toxin [Candidatus Asgardarchaeia archaeon]
MSDRKKQYQRKMDYIIEKIMNLPEPTDDFLIDALFYRIHTCIEATTDLVAMMVKDSGYTVKDDLSNIDTLESNKIISPELAETLKQLNSLRNVLVHRYNKIELEKILRSIDKIRDALLEFVEVVENFIKKNIR